MELVEQCDKLADETVQTNYLEHENSNMECDDLRYAVNSKLNTLLITVAGTAELLGLHKVAGQALDLPKNDKGEPRAIEEIAQAPVGFSPCAHYLKEVADGILFCMGADSSESSMSLLLRILTNASTIVCKDGVTPSRELDVQASVGKVLSAVYPDLLRAPVINKKLRLRYFVWNLFRCGTSRPPASKYRIAIA